MSPRSRRATCPAAPISPGPPFPARIFRWRAWAPGLSGERSGAFWPFWRLMRALRGEGRAPQPHRARKRARRVDFARRRRFSRAFCSALPTRATVWRADAGRRRFRAAVAAAAVRARRRRRRSTSPTQLLSRRARRPHHPAALDRGADRSARQDREAWRLVAAFASGARAILDLVDLLEDQPDRRSLAIRRRDRSACFADDRRSMREACRHRERQRRAPSAARLSPHPAAMKRESACNAPRRASTASRAACALRRAARAGNRC